MRDLHDHHARDIMLDLTGERRDVPQMGCAGPAEPAGGDFGGPATSVWSGGREGVQRPSDDDGDWPIIAGLNARIWDAAVDMAMMTLRGEWGGNLPGAINAVYAAAETVMSAAGSLPLASPEPWVEGDEAYGRRMGFYDSMAGCPSDWLDKTGAVFSLPRARLVPACTPEPRADEETKP